MLKLGRVTIVKVFIPVLVHVFDIDLYKHGYHCFVWSLSANMCAVMSYKNTLNYWLKTWSNIANYYLLKANWSLLFWLGFRFPTECSSDHVHVYDCTI